MPPDPVLLHALRTAPPDRLRRVLYAVADGLSESPDWTEIERLVRERVGLAETLRMLESPGGGGASPTADDLPPAPPRTDATSSRRSRRAR